MLEYGHRALGLAFLLTLPGAGRPSQNNRQPDNRLLTGKLLYVAPMPEGMDQWIVQDLKAWNRYQVTANSEGVDFVMRTHVPEKPTRFVVRNGIPQPAKERKKPPAPSIEVVDWVSGRVIWEAEILDKKPKRDNEALTSGSHVQIRARGLAPNQLAGKVVRAFREYVEQLGEK